MNDTIIRSNPTVRKPRWLRVIVFVAGATGMAVEMSTSRLIAPYFGDSNIVWANLVGLVLLYLTVGYWLGGRIADRRPSPTLLYQITMWAAVGVGSIPWIARPILHIAARGFAQYQITLIGGSFLATLILLAVPVTLLGCVTPFAIRLAITQVEQSGGTTGRIYAISTLGSLVGTFTPPLLLIPLWGTRNTFLAFALLLLVTSLIGIAGERRQWPWCRSTLILLITLGFALPKGPIKPLPGTIYEAESQYNYIQVVESGQTRFLLLNEGEGVHSVYSPDRLTTFGAWDFFAITPFFNPPPHRPISVQNLCIIGLAGGTIARQFTAAYGPIPIDGVEIDPEIVEVGRRFFGMDTLSNLTVHIVDGRFFLAHTEQTYSVIAVDAYRPPYIPFHLTTREFFLLTADHLTEDGVVAVNVGHTSESDRLLESIAATMKQVFPSVHIVDVPDTFNSLIVGTKQPTSPNYLAANLPYLSEDPFLYTTAQRALPMVRDPKEEGMVFTDDHAPVEFLVHILLAQYLLQTPEIPVQLP